MNVQHRLGDIFYVIHACPDRIDFVNSYLVPSLKAQGVENIIVYNDTKKLGNLQGYIDCANSLNIANDDAQIIHLQDDVIPDRRLKEYIEKDYNSDIVCGFNSATDNIAHSGRQKAEYMFWSFQCIRFSHKILKDFIKWIEESGRYYFEPWYNLNKYDDSFFREYIKTQNYITYNI